MKWTAEQELAINTRDRTLLVSAAAGSGKTATLTERIIRSILDPDFPVDISRMLIATYTNAAVDELKQRIAKAIKKAAAENPDNRKLEEQLLKLGDAKILTITSFCNSILRSCAENAGLPPNYRIAEPAEAKILSSSILEGLINAAYEGDIPDVCTPEEFIALADCISSVKNKEGLSEAISFIFDKLTYSEAGIDTLSALVEEYNPENFKSVEQTKYGAYILNIAREAFLSYESAYVKIIGKATGERVDARNLPKAENDLVNIRRMLCVSDYEKARDILSGFSLERISKVAGDADTDFYFSFKSIRSYISDDLKTFSTKYFFYSTEEWRELYTKLYKLLSTLYKFLKKYYEVFANEKKRHGICEFSDVERYAYNALHNPDGSPSSLAGELAEKFDAIYVDEYQDVNALQGKIFAAISKPDNRFMVGDIKQSIYGFRSARPEIFAEMKDSFPLLGGAGDYPYASIFMSDNFRCDETVVRFVNGVFDKIFGLLGKSIGYIENDKLKFSKAYSNSDTPVGVFPEIHITEKPKRNTDSEPDCDEGDEEDKNKNALQAEAIAKKISALIKDGKLANGESIEPRHVAILMRSVRSNLAQCIADALKSHGIASSVNETGDLFMCEEVLLALSFLYAIDNPRKDTYLCAIMMSPIFDFSADEVLLIRKSAKCESLWESLCEYVKANPSFEKGSRFIGELLKYRKLAEGEPTDALLSSIYRECGLMSLASSNGGRENLILLHSFARKYESTDFKGLYSFLSYITAIIERGEEFPAAPSEDSQNAVQIMTIHKSKGLEFPVTILAGASSPGNKDRGAKLLFHENFGIALKVKDDTGLAIVDNPIVHTIQHYINSLEFDEELRVLYVALTRAREYLYIYGSSPKTEAEEYVENIEALREVLDPYLAKKAKSFLDIIMISKSEGKVFIEQTDSADAINGEESNAEQHRSAQENESSLECEDATTKDEYLSRFNFKYPFEHLEKLPEKISVSRLSPAMLDVTDNEAIALEEISLVESFLTPKEDVKLDTDDTERAPILPEFITGKSERESAKRGIATHKVLQFCDFIGLKSNPDLEIERLVKEEFISEEDKARVRRSEIKRFTDSPLFSEIAQSKNLYRELRFNVKLPADMFTEDEAKKNLLRRESILVQGVIDCLIEREDGSLHLVDYKTDRLTKEELLDTELGEERLRRAHTLQLSYYKEAVREMFGIAPKKIGVYSLHLGKEVEIL